MEDRQDADAPFADVLSGEGDSLVLDVVDVEVIADRLDDTVAQPVLMRAAGVRADAVDVAPQVFVRRLGPAKNDFDPGRPLILFGSEDLFVGGPLLRFGRHFFEKAGDSLRVEEFERFVLGLVGEIDLESAVDERNVLEMLADDVDAELHAAEDLVVGAEENRGAVPSEGADFFDFGRGPASLVRAGTTRSRRGARSLPARSKGRSLPRRRRRGDRRSSGSSCPRICRRRAAW